MYGSILILVLAVVGGAIAYVGDWLGMKIGRKKLTLFGLRPKHTSMVVTIATGVLIVSASIGVLSIVSQDVRTALFRMREIQEELLFIQTNYDEMREQRDRAQLDLHEAEAQIEQALINYESVINELSIAEQDVELQRAAIMENEETIARMEDNIENMQAEAAQLQQDIEQLLGAYAALRSDYLDANLVIGQMRESNIAFNASEVILTTFIEQGQDRAQVRSSLESFIRQVDTAAYRRSARNHDASGDYRAIILHPGVIDLVVEDLLLANTDVVVRAVSESNTIPGEPAVVYLESYRNLMVLAAGTVVAELTWDPVNDSEIDRVILQLLDQANNYALDVGMALSSERTAVQLPGDIFLDALSSAREITSPVTLQLVVAKDTWRQEAPVPLLLKINPL